MDTAKDDAVCTCGCHDNPPRLIHVAPCCSPCGDCGRRIRNGMADAHRARCSGKKPG